MCIHLHMYTTGMWPRLLNKSIELMQQWEMFVVSVLVLVAARVRFFLSSG